MKLGRFAFDAAEGELRDEAGAGVRLRAQVREVLRCLAKRANQVVTKDELMRAVWPDVIVTEDSLVQCIAELRRKLEDPQRRIVQTEAKRGYRLVAPAATGSREGANSDAADDLAAEFRQEIRFAQTTDGVRIAYASSGAGAPVVRTAHWMTNVDSDWRSPIQGPLIRRLSSRFSLTRYDCRGCGLSDREVTTAALADWVADLEAVIAAAGLDRFSLLGMSAGMAPAIAYAARHPQRVTRLVLVAGTARGRLRRGKQSHSVANVEAMAQLLRDGWGRESPAYRQLITSSLYPTADPAQVEYFNRLQRESCSARMAALMHTEMACFDAADDLPNIRCPTLVLHSPHDIVPIEEARLCAATIPGALMETFDSPNHLPLPGEPAFEALWRRVEDFLLTTSQERDRTQRRSSSKPVLYDVNEERREARSRSQ